MLGTNTIVIDFHPLREKDDLGSSLQLGGMTLWHRKCSGSDPKTFLLEKTSTGCQQVYHGLHCLRYCQTDH
jgi:hypothetical protein